MNEKSKELDAKRKDLNILEYKLEEVFSNINLLYNYSPFMIKARVLELKFENEFENTKISEIEVADNTGIFTMKVKFEKQLHHKNLVDKLRVGDWYKFLNIKIEIRNQTAILLYDSMSSCMNMEISTKEPFNIKDPTTENKLDKDCKINYKQSMILETINSEFINYFSKNQLIDVIERDYIC